MLATLAGAPHPLSVEQLHEVIRDECDLVTVYRSLAALEAIGMVKRLYAFDGTMLYTAQSGASAYAVLPRGPAPSARLAPEVAAELDVAIQKAAEHLKRAGHRNVQPVVQFFCDPPTT